MKISSTVVGDFNYENNFPHKLVHKFPRFVKLMQKNFSANIKLSKSQVHKIGQSGRFLGRILGPLLKTGLPLIGSVLKPLSKIVLIPLELTASASASDTAIYKKMFGSGVTALIISTEEMIDFMKIVKSLEKSGLLIKGVNETIKNKAKEQKEGFLQKIIYLK